MRTITTGKAPKVQTTVIICQKLSPAAQSQFLSTIVRKKKKRERLQLSINIA
jgi:hypothetical protein